MRVAQKSKMYLDKLQEFKEMVRRIEYLKYTLNSLVYWDKITNMPEKGIGYRSEVMSYLGGELYRAFSDKKLRGLVSYFEGRKENDQYVDAMVGRVKRNYSSVASIPVKEYTEYISLIANAEEQWKKAKEKKDFKIFQPYMEKIVDTFKKFSKYWGYDENPYDAIIEYYEPGVTVSQIDTMAEELKNFIIDLLEMIRNADGEIEEARKSIVVSKEQQMELTRALLKSIGFDFASGRVDEGIHPTTLASSPNDVRIITSFKGEDILVGIFNTLHEGGKGLYEQDIDENLLGTMLAEVASFGLEEGEARIYENIIGRSLGFWKYFYPQLQTICPEYKDIGVEEFYKGLNQVKPSLIRNDADELTYLLHIIIRYEIEKDLINNEIKVKDIPKVWREKYKAYLGIEPENDEEGCLQDIHWASGYFGFFPSYFLANLSAAQFVAAMEKELGAIDELLEAGKLDSIHGWLAENVHKHGAVYTFGELIEKATGEELQLNHYINYLQKKYFEVYKLNK